MSISVQFVSTTLEVLIKKLSSVPKDVLSNSPNSKLVTEHVEFLRITNNRDIFYFDTLSCDACSDVNIVIDDCVAHFSFVHCASIKTMESDYRKM